MRATIFSKVVISSLLLLAVGALLSQSSQAAQSVYPVVDLSRGCLLGGSGYGKWISYGATAPFLKGKEQYRLYALGGARGVGVGNKPESFGAPCEETKFIEVSTNPNTSGEVIAVGGNWNALPRTPQAVSPNQKVYSDAASALLKKNGIANPKVKVVQVLRVDLEGDGVLEVLVTATNYTYGADPITPRAEAGDYSMVFLRKVVRGKVETVELAADYVTKRFEFGAPSRYDVAAVLDLNGDGVMEIILHGEYYEGAWSTVYTVKGLKVEEVLGCGCGA